jgi:hypothetical protein
MGSSKLQGKTLARAHVETLAHFIAISGLDHGVGHPSSQYPMIVGRYI